MKSLRRVRSGPANVTPANVHAAAAANALGQIVSTDLPNHASHRVCSLSCLCPQGRHSRRCTHSRIPLSAAQSVTIPPMRPLAATLFLALASLPACVSMQPGFDSPEPAARIDAILAAARANDTSAVPDLVALLDSDDPATRLLAIRTLEKLTGTTNDYDYAANDAQREKGVERWLEWLRRRGMAPKPSPPAPVDGDEAPKPE